MVKKLNYGKILATVFLTCLIWVWADLAQDEELSLPNVTISVVPGASSNLWVNFDEQSSISVDNIVLKGSVTKIAEIRRKLKESSTVFELLLDPRQEAMTTPGEHSLNVAKLVRQNEYARQYGLTVESCEPDTVNVNVIELVKKTLTVKCFDETGNEIKTKAIVPAQVEMFVPSDWEGEKLIADVVLSPLEESQAIAAITKVPYIEFGDEKRSASRPVKITTSPQEDRLGDYTITMVTLKFSLSSVLQGKYGVQVSNLDQVIGPIAIRATPQAKRAFENQPYHVRLEIDDSDAAVTEEIRREIVYNFPEEFVRKNEIRLSQNQQPEAARFRLIPLAVPDAP